MNLSKQLLQTYERKHLMLKHMHDVPESLFQLVPKRVGDHSILETLELGKRAKDRDAWEASSDGHGNSIAWLWDAFHKSRYCETFVRCKSCRTIVLYEDFETLIHAPDCPHAPVSGGPSLQAEMNSHPGVEGSACGHFSACTAGQLEPISPALVDREGVPSQPPGATPPTPRKRLAPRSSGRVSKLPAELTGIFRNVVIDPGTFLSCWCLVAEMCVISAGSTSSRTKKNKRVPSCDRKVALLKFKHGG